jgi:GGDEF domain-containing protein
MKKKTGLSTHLQKMSHGPEVPDLHQLLSQALENRGQHFQISWRASDKVALLFTLNATRNLKSGDLEWTLYLDRGTSREIAFSFSSLDVLLVHNKIIAASSEAHKTLKSFAGQSSSLSQSGMQAVPAESGEAGGGNVRSLTGIDAEIDRFWHESDGRVRPAQRNAPSVHGESIVASNPSHILDNDETLQQVDELDRLFAYLQDAGVLPTSILAPAANLSELDFVQKAALNAPVDLGMLSDFYRNLNGKQSIEEIAQSMELSTDQTVRTIYHLVTRQLVKVWSDDDRPVMKPRPIDNAAIEGVMMSLRRGDTGMYTYPAFLYFLEQEFFRSYRAGSPFTVIVFDLRHAVHSGIEKSLQALSKAALVDAVLRISQLKRYQDLLAHYDAFHYALLLPNTKTGGAQVFANRIIKSLTASPLAGIDAKQLSLVFGGASIPEDFVDLSSLLGAADAAMEHARRSGQSLVMYRDIKKMLV